MFAAPVHLERDYDHDDDAATDDDDDEHDAMAVHFRYVHEEEDEEDEDGSDEEDSPFVQLRRMGALGGASMFGAVSRGAGAADGRGDAPGAAKWACGVCTFENSGWKSRCDMCGTARSAPVAVAAGPTEPPTCVAEVPRGQFDMLYQFMAAPDVKERRAALDTLRSFLQSNPVSRAGPSVVVCALWRDRGGASLSPIRLVATRLCRHASAMQQRDGACTRSWMWCRRRGHRVRPGGVVSACRREGR